MTRETQISAQLAQLAEFAAREDWRFQAEIELAAELSLTAQAFCEKHPGTEEICRHFIGRDSVLVFEARTNIFQSLKTIAYKLDQMRGLGSSLLANADWSDYLAAANPAQSFFRAEVAKRQLQTFGD